MRRAATALRLVRLGYGVALAAVPDALGAPVAGRPLTSRERVVARALGARHVVEALVLRRHPGWAARVAVAVDGLHAASMLGLAALRREHRRLPAVDAVVASGFAAATVLAARASR